MDHSPTNHFVQQFAKIWGHAGGERRIRTLVEPSAGDPSEKICVAQASEPHASPSRAHHAFKRAIPPDGLDPVDSFGRATPTSLGFVKAIYVVRALTLAAPLLPFSVSLSQLSQVDSCIARSTVIYRRLQPALLVTRHGTAGVALGTF